MLAAQKGGQMSALFLFSFIQIGNNDTQKQGEDANVKLLEYFGVGIYCGKVTGKYILMQ